MLLMLCDKVLKINSIKYPCSKAPKFNRNVREAQVTQNPDVQRNFKYQIP